MLLHVLFAHSAYRIGLKVIVNIDEIIPSSFLLVKFLHNRRSNLVAELLNVAEVTIHVLQLLLNQCIFHDFRFYNIISRLWIWFGVG